MPGVIESELSDHESGLVDGMVFNPLPDDKILDWSKFKQIADDILKCI